MEFFSHPVGKLVTIETNPWHYEDWIVLIGDACHAVYPFYGQGMNAALEDCLLLEREIYRRNGSWAEVLSCFATQRKLHTDVLAQLSKENFLELSNRLQSPLFVVRRRLDVLLNQLFPEVWLPLYTMVSHTTMPYGDALKRAKKQERWLKYLLLILTTGVGLLSWRIWQRQRGD
jgi:kynurenine 3-monooxygenase